MLDCEKDFNPGEKATHQYLIENGYSVIDTRKDPDLRDKYDYVGYKGNEKITFEAKYDNYIHRSGQMVYELYHLKQREDGDIEYKTGWSEKTEADYLCYYDIVNSLLYIMKMDQIKKFVRYKYLPCKSTNKDKYKTTYFKLITIKEFEQIGFDVERYYIDRSKWEQLIFNAQ